MKRPGVIAHGWLSTLLALLRRAFLMIIVSVSGIAEKQLKHIAKRAEKTFPGSRVLLLDLTEGSAGGPSDQTSQLVIFNRFSEFLASARLKPKSAERVSTAAAAGELLGAP